MANNDTTMTQEPLVLVTQQSGVTVIPQPTPLTRLNYFDGKFLRASDLSAEQLYLRRLIDLSNQAGGPGIAYGYNISLAAGGDLLNLGPGLAIDPQGRVLLLPTPFSTGVQELIDRSRQLKSPSAASGSNGTFADCTVVLETPPDGVVQVGNLYLIVIGFAEALCGQEDVFGKLCEQACATSTDRPYLVEGVVLRAIPLQLLTPLPTSAVVALSQLHLRSRVASAYFEDERRQVASFISGEGLRSNVWCLGAEGAGGGHVPLGVLARAGGSSLFLDAWIARRERMDTPAKRYWQWRMAMRPWDVFVAQILQFQCQLSDVFQKQPPAGGDDDPCERAHGIVREAADAVARIADYYKTVTTRFTLQPLLIDGKASTEKAPVLEGGLSKLIDFQGRLEAVNTGLSLPSSKVLIDGGIVEVPSAGYLPVLPNSVTSVNQQVTRLLGKGVDLRFCIVRPDFVAHALEAAQHMERISLLEGLDHPDHRPEVDVLVPNGEPLAITPATGVAYEAVLALGGGTTNTSSVALLDIRKINRPLLRGAAHIEIPVSGSVQFFTAVDRDVSQPGATVPTGAVSAFGRAVLAQSKLNTGLSAGREVLASDLGVGRIAVTETHQSLWAAATCSENFMAAQSGGQALLELRIVVSSGAIVEDLLLSGRLTFDRPVILGAQRVVKGFLVGTLSIVVQVGTKRQEQNIRVSHEVTAILSTPNDQAPTLQITLVNFQPRIVEEITATWSGSPRKIAVSVKEAFGFSGQESGQNIRQITLFDAEFTRNDDVLLPTNALHVAALQGLDALGTALGNPQFSPSSAALLFPPPPQPADDLQIRAVLDWVLFHRRRTKQCQTITVAPQIPVRRYQLWNGRVANQDFLKRTIDALHNKTPFDKDGVVFQRVDVVEFAPGIQTLISPKSVVQGDWLHVKPGQQILYAGIASGDAATQDGAILAKGRLNEVEQTLAQVTSPADTLVVEVLDAIHPDLAAPSLDGSIVVLTIRQTTCVTVAQVSPELIGRVRSVVSDGNIAAALKLATVVGEVEFTTGTVEVQDDSLAPVVQKWKDQGLLGLPNTALVAIQAGDSRVPQAIAVSQGRTIQVALGVGQPPDVQTSPAALPDCPVILFVASQAAVLTRVGRVVVWTQRDRQGNRVVNTAVGTPDVTFAADGSLSGGVPGPVVNALKQVGVIAQIELAPVDDAFDAALATKRLNAIADALAASGLYKESTPRQVTKLAAAERSLAGTVTNDVIFVRPG